MLRPDDVPEELRAGAVQVRFAGILEVDESNGLVPAYHFNVLNADGVEVGHINFRVGSTRHVQMTAGHVGFAIDEAHRGIGYALQACQALAPFVRRHYERVILTAEPDNVASLRTIERLGATFIDEVEVPVDDPGYASGARRKRRYEWKP